MAWSENPRIAAPACIYWLNGVAGTGKSTICRTIASNLQKQGRLGASFFYSRGQGDLSNARKFVTTIAYQLAQSLPELVPEICKAMADSANIAVGGLRDQWEHLVRQPLLNLGPVSGRTRPLVLVIDALDECEGDDDVKLMLHLFSTLTGTLLRTFITSRPEIPIRLGFAKIVRTEKDSARRFILHNIERSIIEHDIKIFLKVELTKVSTIRSMPQGWPGDDNIERLCQMTGGLFISAATACRYVADPLWDANERLKMILQHSYIGKDPTARLDGIYNTVIQQSLKLVEREDQTLFSSEFSAIVGSIVVLLDTLSIRTLARLLDIRAPKIVARLNTLHSVLEVPDDAPVKLLHLSFRDFLLDPERCIDPRIAVEERVTHYGLFLCCMRVMGEQLRQDICNLVDPGTKIGNIAPSVVRSAINPELQYAVRFWVQHLDASGRSVPKEVYDFMRKRFLYWLEVLSLVGDMHGGIISLTKLESKVPVSVPKTSAKQG